MDPPGRKRRRLSGAFGASKMRRLNHLSMRRLRRTAVGADSAADNDAEGSCSSALNAALNPWHGVSEMHNSYDDISQLLTLDIGSFRSIATRMDLFNSKESTTTSYELLYSWNKCRPDIIDTPRHQLQDDCWRYALARGQSSLVKRLGLESSVPILTPDILRDGIARKHICEQSGSLKGIHNTIGFLKSNGYVKKMIIHQRLKSGNSDKHFEELLRRLLPISPVVLVFSVLPSYRQFNGNKAVYIPTVKDRNAMKFEEFPIHTVLATGHGIAIRAGDITKFVEVQDSFGKDWGEDGFLKLALHSGYIKQVIELQV